MEEEDWGGEMAAGKCGGGGRNGGRGGGGGKRGRDACVTQAELGIDHGRGFACEARECRTWHRMAGAGVASDAR
ncbi:hypothetical protein Ga0100230_008780 [Opitutaceae bacterium TAV3]|nr:hypothetical protein Ga0100230_008780 [Opitutaceae bacterium TAV3]